MTSSIAQPKRKPASGPYASRKKTYWPPAFGSIAASSAHESAPASVRAPAAAQTASSPAPDWRRRALSAETMKMPEPIMDPTTSATRRAARFRGAAPRRPGGRGSSDSPESAPAGGGAPRSSARQEERARADHDAGGDQRHRRGAVGGGGAGIRARSAGVAQRRRESSRARLSSPRAIAQRWLNSSSGRSSGESARRSGFSARTRQSYVIAVQAPSCSSVHSPLPARSPSASSENRGDGATR